MWVKICANTNLEDALLAIEAGADAVGFVFAPSRRQVSVAQVRAITHRLPDNVERVGVFASQDAEAIGDAALEAGLTAIQLHDTLDATQIGTLRERVGPRVFLIPVVHWPVDSANPEVDVTTKLEALVRSGLTDRVLIDAKVGSASGGLGVSFDWNQACAVVAGFPSLRVVLAGGLGPASVAAAIATLHPYGVDVASGVELQPGRKDPAKLRSFIENARRAS